MKKLATLLLLLNSFALFAAGPTCSNIIRAVNTDQEDMAVGSALYKYKLNPQDILKIELTDYLSWKEKQVSCLADIRHTAILNLQFIKVENQVPMLCLLKAKVHRFDHFLTESPESVYSFSDESTSCQVESSLETSERLSCQSRPCPYSAVKLYRDVKDNCSCKSIWDYPIFKDHAEDYLDFYNPSKFFLKE